MARWLATLVQMTSDVFEPYYSHLFSRFSVIQFELVSIFSDISMYTVPCFPSWSHTYPFHSHLNISHRISDALDGKIFPKGLTRLWLSPKDGIINLLVSSAVTLRIAKLSLPTFRDRNANRLRDTLEI